MPPSDLASAEATAEFFMVSFGASALLEASVCGHQAILDNDVERCRFWRQVLERIEASKQDVANLNKKS
jgi:hypothetical protein